MKGKSDRLLGTVEEYFGTYATIEEPTIYPAAEQALACLCVCQIQHLQKIHFEMLLVTVEHTHQPTNATVLL